MKKHWFDNKSTQAQAEYVGKHPKTKFNVRRLLDTEGVEIPLQKNEHIEDLMEALNDYEVKEVVISGNYNLMHNFFFTKWLKNQKDKNQTQDNFMMSQMIKEIGESLSTKTCDCKVEKVNPPDWNNFKFKIIKTKKG